VPILTGDVPIGVLNVDSGSKNAFSSADLVYVTLLGAILSVVLALGRGQGEDRTLVRNDLKRA
jgi:putative methionine-R-sulfoxide reductase with GAF domain